MQSHYPAAFEREMGCTESELLGWLPGACGGRSLVLSPGRAEIEMGDGSHLVLAWQSLPPRRIALMTVPRLAIRFAFEGVDEIERHRFMRYFDLHTQRGGG
jgi:hypothetical protein